MDWVEQVTQEAYRLLEAEPRYISAGYPRKRDLKLRAQYQTKNLFNGQSEGLLHIEEAAGAVVGVTLGAHKKRRYKRPSSSVVGSANMGQAQYQTHGDNIDVQDSSSSAPGQPAAPMGERALPVPAVRPAQLDENNQRAREFGTGPRPAHDHHANYRIVFTTLKNDVQRLINYTTHHRNNLQEPIVSSQLDYEAHRILADVQAGLSLARSALNRVTNPGTAEDLREIPAGQIQGNPRRAQRGVNDRPEAK